MYAPISDSPSGVFVTRALIPTYFPIGAYCLVLLCVVLYCLVEVGTAVLPLDPRLSPKVLVTKEPGTEHPGIWGTTVHRVPLVLCEQRGGGASPSPVERDSSAPWAHSSALFDPGRPCSIISTTPAILTRGINAFTRHPCTPPSTMNSSQGVSLVHGGHYCRDRDALHPGAVNELFAPVERVEDEVDSDAHRRGGE